MSRHTVLGFDPTLDITVGWDRPMRTFFAIVKDRAIDDPEDEGDPDPILLWLGGTFDEIAEVHGLVAGLASFADLTIALVEQLQEDQRTGA